MLITGAAGFVGRAACTYYAERFLIIGIDDFSRATARQPPRCNEFYCGDAGELVFRSKGYDVILHLAAQVSVVQSYADPLDDFRRNAEVTLWLARQAAHAGVKTFIYASTNKVYGANPSLPVRMGEPINPQTPYGISKAAGGLYVREFLPRTGYDFRQSCIYSEDQQGSVDQGWIGFLRRQIAAGEPITCFGDGTQIRDLLHVVDLLRAYDLAIAGIIEPGSYTVGGGEDNAVSFQEAVTLLGGSIHAYADWRPHDQRAFVSANDGLWQTAWAPRINARQWLKQNRVRTTQTQEGVNDGKELDFERREKAGQPQG